MSALTGEWERALHEEFSKEYYKNLFFFIRKQYSETIVYPKADEIFTAFHLTPLEKVKVVILGQDPYHNEGQAHGLCFSVKPQVAIPPSLENIYKELHDDLGCKIPSHGCLTSWAKQGVLLLNTVLTVQAHKPMSHRGVGWEEFTDAVIRRLNDEREHIVFMLWGAYAQKKGTFIDRTRHCVLTAPHPSPLSADRGFFGCKHFSKANAYFRSKGLAEIEW